MICEKCGMRNSDREEYCAFCGKKLPSTSGGNGFGDILSFSGPAAKATPTANTEKAMEAMLHQQRQIKKCQTFIGVVAVTALIISVVGLMTPQQKNIVAATDDYDILFPSSYVTAEPRPERTETPLITEETTSTETPEPIDTSEPTETPVSYAPEPTAIPVTTPVTPTAEPGSATSNEISQRPGENVDLVDEIDPDGE